eukprot:GGOE01013879.1.p1 GENE.GGOE01013879.1~~GGOE01013879.1.p1  ORF type:complete len:311 (-),score=59.39 GGOE01013879.1:315-1247(-)
MSSQHSTALPSSLLKTRSPRASPTQLLPQAPSPSPWARCTNMVQVVFEVYWLRPEANTTLWVKLDVPSCENGVRLAPPRGSGKPYTTTCLLPAEQRLHWWVGIEHERETIEWTVTPRNLYTKGVTFVCHVLWGPSPADNALHYMQARMEDWQKAAPSSLRNVHGSSRRSASVVDLHPAEKHKSAFHPHNSTFSKGLLNTTLDVPKHSPKQQQGVLQLSESIIPEDPHNHSVSFLGSDISITAAILSTQAEMAALEDRGKAPTAETALVKEPLSMPPEPPSPADLTPRGSDNHLERMVDQRNEKKWGWWSK